MEIPEIVEVLERTPGQLRQHFASLPQEAAGRAPAAGDWSAAEVLAHLRASDAIIAPRIFHVLTRPGAPLPAFDDRVWMALDARAGLPISVQLDAFAARRAELVGVLRALTPEEWSLEGEHESHGRLTIRRIAGMLAEHEREHLAQIEALLAGA